MKYPLKIFFGYPKNYPINIQRYPHHLSISDIQGYPYSPHVLGLLMDSDSDSRRHGGLRDKEATQLLRFSESCRMNTTTNELICHLF